MMMNDAAGEIFRGWLGEQARCCTVYKVRSIIVICVTSRPQHLPSSRDRCASGTTTVGSTHVDTAQFGFFLSGPNHLDHRPIQVRGGAS